MALKRLTRELAQFGKQASIGLLYNVFHITALLLVSQQMTLLRTGPPVQLVTTCLSGKPL
jgi:hypothetical protein